MNYKLEQVKIRPIEDVFFSILASSKYIVQNDIDFFFDYYQIHENKESFKRIGKYSISYKIDSSISTFEGGKDGVVYKDELGKERVSPGRPLSGSPINGKYYDHIYYVKDFATKETERRISSRRRNDPECWEAADPDEKNITGIFYEKTIRYFSFLIYYWRRIINDAEMVKVMPEIACPFSDFIGIDNCDIDKACEMYVAKTISIRQFIEKNETETEKVYHGYKSLKSLYESMLYLLDQKDVMDNFESFKLLIRYHELVPIMYILDVVNDKTINRIFKYVKKDLGYFNNMADFLDHFYLPLKDKFGHTVHSVQVLSRMVKNKSKNDSDDETKALKEKVTKLPFSKKLIHGLEYYPLYLLQAIERGFLFLLRNLDKLFIPVFIFILFFISKLLSSKTGIDNIFGLKAIMDPEAWKEIISNKFLANVTTDYHGKEYKVATIQYLVYTFMVVILPSYLLADIFTKITAIYIKKTNIIGMKQAFKKLDNVLLEKAGYMHEATEESIKARIGIIITNILVPIVIVVGIIVAIKIFLIK